MTIRLTGVRVDAVDERHCVAHVDWNATYAGDGASDTALAFQVHYLVQLLPNDEPRVFGWISGDEQAVLEEYGIG
jgi:hypothetical protein